MMEERACREIVGQLLLKIEPKMTENKEKIKEDPVGRGLAGWLVGRLVGWLVVRLVGWSVGELVGWLVGWLVIWVVNRTFG